MNIKKAQLIFIAFFFAPVCGFSKANTKNLQGVLKAIGNNWISSENVSVNENGIHVATQMQQRLINLRGTVLPIATLTKGEIESPDGRGIPQDLSGHLAKVMGISHWKQEDRGAYVAYEAQVPQEARLVKLFVSKSKTKFRYSIFTVRMAYLLPLYFEAELIQRNHMSGNVDVVELEKNNK